MRTTKAQVENQFHWTRLAAIEADVPNASTWELDYAPCYGGWCVELKGGSDSLGSGMMNANRMTAGPFVQSLRMVHDVCAAIVARRLTEELRQA